MISESHERARALVLEHGWNAMSYQILTPGMSHWFSGKGDAVAGYMRFGNVRVVAGAPACAASRLADVTDELEADGQAEGCRTIYFAAGSRLEQILGARRTHSLTPIGSLPTWRPGDWRATVAGKASLRAQVHRARNKGVHVYEVPATPDEVSALRPVLHAWLATRGLPPLGFMTSSAILDLPGDRRVFVAERDSTPAAYLVAAPVPARDGWLIEQWPRRPSAPNGTTHLLIDAAMQSFASSGSGYVTLGMAPLADRADTSTTPLPHWLKFLFGWMRAHGRRFYNFRGLESFKASLEPAGWEPVYVIAPGPALTLSMLRAIAGVFANGHPERFIARGLVDAVRRELTGSRGPRI